MTKLQYDILFHANDIYINKMNKNKIEAKGKLL